VRHTKDNISVITKSGEVYDADYIIVAMPPININRIIFSPKLSENRETINQKNFMGAIIKVLILYESRFWKDKGFSGETVSDCIDSPVFNAYDDSRPKGNG
jgi:monoamine oxidase